MIITEPRGILALIGTNHFGLTYRNLSFEKRSKSKLCRVVTMSNRNTVERRAIQSAEEILHRQNYVSSIDVLVGMRLLQAVHVQDWRKGKIPYLEKVIQGNLKKISFVMQCFRRWATQKGLKPSKTTYLARTYGPKRDLQWSKSGDPSIESAYQTHYVSSGSS